MSKSELKRVVACRSRRMTAIEDRHDPGGLLVMGCPKDEYENEIKEIAKKIGGCKDGHDVFILVDKVFEEAFFSGFLHVDTVLALSNDLYATLNQN